MNNSFRPNSLPSAFLALGLGVAAGIYSAVVAHQKKQETTVNSKRVEENILAFREAVAEKAREAKKVVQAADEEITQEVTRYASLGQRALELKVNKLLQEAKAVGYQGEELSPTQKTVESLLKEARVYLRVIRVAQTEERNKKLWHVKDGVYLHDYLEDTGSLHLGEGNSVDLDWANFDKSAWASGRSNFDHRSVSGFPGVAGLNEQVAADQDLPLPDNYSDHKKVIFSDVEEVLPAHHEEPDFLKDAEPAEDIAERFAHDFQAPVEEDAPVLSDGFRANMQVRLNAGSDEAKKAVKKPRRVRTPEDIPAKEAETLISAAQVRILALLADGEFPASDLRKELNVRAYVVSQAMWRLVDDGTVVLTDEMNLRLP
jgi:hypothetical protein